MVSNKRKDVRKKLCDVFCGTKLKNEPEDKNKNCDKTYLTSKFDLFKHLVPFFDSLFCSVHKESDHDQEVYVKQFLKE